MRSQVRPRIVPTGEHSRFLPQAHIANSPVAMTARTTMKLKSLLPGVGDLQFRFPTKPTKAEQKKIQRDLKTNLERIMVKWGAEAREKNPKMARDGAKGPLLTERNNNGCQEVICDVGRPPGRGRHGQRCEEEKDDDQSRAVTRAVRRGHLSLGGLRKWGQHRPAPHRAALR